MSARGRLAELERDIARRREERRARLAAEILAARSEARIERVAAERETIDRVLRRAEEILDAPEPCPCALAAMPGVLADALARLPGAPAVVRCRPALAAGLRDALAGLEDVTLVEDGTVPAGLVAQSPDGSFVVDASFIADLRRLRPLLAVELLAELHA